MVRLSLTLLAIVALCSAHSEMICANYDTSSNKCLAPIRNSGQTIIQQSYVFSANPSQICQIPFRSPVSSYYANGAGCPSWAPCPDPMGSIKAGSTFNVMWYARNHAVANQNPRTVAIYLSPAITSQTSSDPSFATMQNNKICEGSFMNCPNGNGDTNQCYLQCTMPSNVASGTYTLLWYWDWTVNDGKIYSTCADITVTGGSGTVTTGVQSTTGSSLATTGVKSTTGSTTGAQTTGSASTSGSSGTTGSSNTNGCESVILSITPKTIAPNSVFNVTLGYRSQGSRDLVVDLVNGNSWYGKGVVTVPAGKGAATATVTVQGNPPAGSSYQFHAWSVNQGMANVANAWNSAYDNDLKSVTVSNMVSY